MRLKVYQKLFNQARLGIFSKLFSELFYRVDLTSIDLICDINKCLPRHHEVRRSEIIRIKSIIAMMADNLRFHGYDRKTTYIKFNIGYDVSRGRVSQIRNVVWRLYDRKTKRAHYLAKGKIPKIRRRDIRRYYTPKKNWGNNIN